MRKTLPNNWVETELANLVSFIIGGDWGSEPDSDLDDSTLTLCIRGGELKEWRKNKGNTAVLRRIKNSSLEKRKLELGDILLEISGGGPDQPVGRTVYIDKDVLNFNVDIPKICTNFFRQIKLHTIIDSKYVNSYLQYFYIAGDITNYQGGSNNLRNLKYKDYETIQIPLPPLPEQERIANKLEALFAQLDSIRIAMEGIPALLKNFRQQVLTQAVTGKLTEDWREGKELEDAQTLIYNIKNKRIELYKKQCEYNLKKGIRKPKEPILEIVADHNLQELIPLSWSICSIGDISDVCNGSTPSRQIEDYWNGDIPWVSSGLVQNNRINKTNEFITEFGLKNSSTRILPIGTVLLAMIGEGKTRGQSAILDIEATINQNIAAIIIEHKLIISEYLQYYLIYNYESNRKEGNGTGPQALNCQKVRELSFILAPLQEQQEIVCQVKSLFSQADTIEQQYKNLKQKIDNLPQAILQKAFKGELVEQLATDGDARDLLRQIEKLKESTKKKK